MVLSLVKLSSIAAVLGASTSVATKTYQMSEEYKPSNFFDKFNFYVSNFSTGNPFDVDPTHGYVNYRTQADAQSLGLISTTAKSDVYIGVDSKSKRLNHDGSLSAVGRDSVRIESTSMYSQGLIIAKFNHLPQQACGSWPAFWAFGKPWLTKGEVDMYEGYNLPGYNTIAAHTDPDYAGTCTIVSESSLQSGIAKTTDCNNKINNPPMQYPGTGCTGQDTSNIWASSVGGTIALEITSEHVKVWSWLPGHVPADVTTGVKPDPTSSAWGLPQFYISKTGCDVSRAFQDMQLIFDITFCGDAAGNPGVWGASSCSSQAGNCTAYVANNPQAYTDTYWEVEGIKVYQMKEAQVSTTTSSTATSSTPTTSSTSTTSSASTDSTSSEASTTSSTASTPSSGYPTSSGPSVPSSDARPTPTSSTSGASTSSGSGESSYGPYAFKYANTTSSSAQMTSSAPYSAQEMSSVPYSAKMTTSASYSAQMMTSASYSAQMMTSVSSSAQVTTSKSSSVEMTTSTVFSTRTYTITSCAPTVTDCPERKVTTEVVPWYTTVCPVSKASVTSSPKPSKKKGSKSKPSNKGSSPKPGPGYDTGRPSYITSTIYITKTYTVTSCAPTVTYCPVGLVTVDVKTTTTVYPAPPPSTLVASPSGKPSPGGSGPQGSSPATTQAPGKTVTTTVSDNSPATQKQGNSPAPNSPAPNPNPSTAKPYPSGAASPSGYSYRSTGAPVPSPSSNSDRYQVSGSTRLAAEGLMLVVAAAAVMFQM